MPRLTGKRLPKYRKHASGQALISLDGRDIYLGPHGSKASRLEYDRVVSEWLANGRMLPSQTGLSINELALPYIKFANGYYRKNGKPTASVDGIKIALRFLCRGYGRTPAHDFGPLALAAIRNTMIEAGHSRVYINKNIDRIDRDRNPGFDLFFAEPRKWIMSARLRSAVLENGMTGFHFIPLGESQGDLLRAYPRTEPRACKHP